MKYPATPLAHTTRPLPSNDSAAVAGPRRSAAAGTAGGGDGGGGDGGDGGGGDGGDGAGDDSCFGGLGGVRSLSAGRFFAHPLVAISAPAKTHVTPARRSTRQKIERVVPSFMVSPAMNGTIPEYYI
jgi:hypothetical protein